MPAALPGPLLEAANGALMGVRQVAMLAGPMLAAVLLGTTRHGLALAFAIDCASFIVSAWTLANVAVAPSVPAVAQSVWREVGAGLRMVWRDVPMRLCFAYWALVSLCLGGAMQVALPILANDTYDGGTTLGWLMGAHGAGMLFGMAAAALGGKRLHGVRFGSMILLVDALAGCLLAPLGMIGHAWLVALLLLVLGAFSGFLQITVYTWIQRRVPDRHDGPRHEYLHVHLHGPGAIIRAGRRLAADVDCVADLVRRWRRAAGGAGGSGVAVHADA